ncbi:nucleoredoxin isoform X2 [Nilaparvata lugens]|nr:nucleoredoxin isoform X2 [Nilaparvata lugens]
MPLHQQIKQIRLMHKYEARDCSLVLIDGSTGKELTRSAKERVLEDAEGLRFPWPTCAPAPAAQKISHLLSCICDRGLLRGGSDSTSLDHETCEDALQDCVIGVYFSAHWCPPCRAFTPQLIDTYNELKERGKKFQVLFVSSDRSVESFKSYLSIMPWLALPYDESELRQDLAKLFDIHGIPTLVILNTDHSLITIDGRGEINDDPLGKRFPWGSPISLLTERTATRLYNTPTVVLFLEGENEEDFNFGKSVLTTAASNAQMQADGFNLYSPIFFIAFDSNTSEWLRDYVGLDDDAPLLTIIDLPLGRISVMEYGVDISEESVNEFVASFLNDTLPFTFIGQL